MPVKRSQPEQSELTLPGYEVRVPLQEKYIFPDQCVVCAKPPVDKAFYRAVMQKNNPNPLAPGGWYEIGFPICNECAEVQKTAHKKSRASCLPSALTGVGSFVLILLLTRYNIIAALMAGCFFTILGVILFSWLVDRKISKDFFARYQLLRTSARITGLEVSKQPDDSFVLVKFSSDEYAGKFASLNKGERI